LPVKNGKCIHYARLWSFGYNTEAICGNYDAIMPEMRAESADKLLADCARINRQPVTTENWRYGKGEEESKKGAKAGAPATS
jgi:hypothetical protein